MIAVLKDKDGYLQISRIKNGNNVLEAHHKVKPESLEIRNTNGYDHAGRHVDTKIRVTTDGTQWPEEDLCNKRHTVKEQLKYMKLSGSLQQIDYVYKKNRYLHSINGNWDAQDLFFMELGYDNHVASQIPSGNQVKRYNGDISEIEWRYRNTGGSSTPFQNYNYKYNYLDMLTAADYYESGKNGHYTTSYTYKDDRGNFDKLTRRHANVLIDDLVYVKKTGSNLLEEIDDESGSSLGYKESTGYLHDGNGFITFDPEIGATITRDHLNHITTIALPNAINVSSSRDANGQLHRRIIDSAGVLTTIDRIGACEFRNGALSVIHHDNGYITMNRAAPEELYLTGTVSHTKTEQGVSITSERVLNAGANETNEAQEEIVMKPLFEVKTGAVYTAEIKEFPVQGLTYHYVIKDHLGSPRVVFQDVNNNNSIDFATDLGEVKNYYPFGLEWEEPTQETAKYSNAYNNKERTPHTKYLDFGARNYIKSANVFDGPDMISSSFPHLTTINYAANRVPNGIDLHGLQFVPARDLQGNVDPEGTKATLHGSAKAHLENSDLNDAVILGTTITRGHNAIDISGNPVGIGDQIAAGLGAIIPIVSGSAVKNFFKGIFGKSNAAEKIAKEASESHDEVEVFRVFGGKAKAEGFSFTTVDPNKVDNFRDCCRFAGC